MSKVPSFNCRSVLVAVGTILGLFLGSEIDGPTPAAAGEPGKSFIDVTEAMGLKGMSSGPAAWGDFDNDGWVDLCVGGQVWRNEKGKRFTKVGQVAGSAIWGDFDNDGYLDLFCYETGRLFRNLNGKEFKEVKFPPRPMKVSIGACWGDFDGDGFLDIYLAGYEADNGYQPHAIFRNQGDGTFKQTWRTKERFQPGRGVTAADFNEDGHLDIFVSNYRLEANNLWLGDGKGKFTDVAKTYGAAGNQKLGAYGHTIGSAWGDLDNDGHLDLFVGNFSHPPDYQDRSQFLRNKGPKHKFHFEDMTKIAKLRWQESYASPTLGDYDNDGLLDLYFTTVYAGDKSVLYRNLGQWKFEEIKGSAGLTPALTYQAAWADFDNDGQLDLVTGGRLFRNPGTRNHWLKVHLQGGGKVNRAAIGAQVRLRLGNQTLTRQVEGATGQGNQNDLTLHFGLGNHKDPVRLEIRWTDGTRQELQTAVDRTIAVKRGASNAQNASAGPETPVDVPRVRRAVEKSLPFLQKEGLAWETTKCVSCHHGPWMMWSGYVAKKRGFAVNDKSLEQVRANALKAYSKHPTMRPTSRDVLNDLAINVIYLTFGMGAAGEPDAETAKFFDKAAAHLIEQQKENGSWKVFIKMVDGRPVPSSTTTPQGVTKTLLMAPLIDGDDVTTLWALLALNYREPSGIPKEALVRSKEKGLKFLSDHPPSDTLQALVLRIMLYHRLHKKDEVQALVRQLLTLQNGDGGWSQTKRLKSDALGTGQALVALSSAGLTAKDAAITKAWGYLIKNQKPDGSWFVASRAYQAPPFSSYMGTAWATLALVRTLPENRHAPAKTAVPTRQPVPERVTSPSSARP